MKFIRSVLITVLIALAIIAVGGLSVKAAATLLNLATQVQGLLAVANGGTGAATSAADTVFGNATGSTAAPGFTANPVVTGLTATGSVQAGNSSACTYGTGGAFCSTEGTAPTAASALDLIYGDSTYHSLMVSQNNYANNGLVTFFPVQVNVLTTQTTTYSISVDDSAILCNGTFTSTLPASGIPVGKTYRFKNIGTGTCTLSAGGTVKIDASTTYVTSVQYTAVDVVWDGTQYWIF